MAFSDTIPQLELFRGQCKPTWLFVAGGQPVTVMHGANAPLLQRMIETEMRKERQVLKGEAEREIISLEDAVPSKYLPMKLEWEFSNHSEEITEAYTKVSWEIYFHRKIFRQINSSVKTLFHEFFAKKVCACVRVFRNFNIAQ